MPLNGKFQEKYGLAWKDMDMDARMQAVMSEIFDLREAVDPVSATCKKVDRHETYFKALWWIVGVVSVALTGVLIDLIFRGGAH